MSVTSNNIRTCSLDGCSKPIGMTPYVIAGKPDQQYCSRACCDVAYEAMHTKRKKKSATPEQKEESNMQVTAEEFGDAGITRLLCDKCRKPITMEWRGRNGTYCSNNCLKSSEEGESNMTTEDTATATAPVTAGKPKAKKATVKKAAVKKAKASSNGSGNGNDARTIKLTKKDCELRGKRLAVFKMIKDGMTVGDYKHAVMKKFNSSAALPTVVLKVCVENGLCSVKG